VMGLLTSLHYDFVVDAVDSLATVVRLELVD
jgi:tRNA A37 threonylcarbamoyladenosine dehydratase